MPLPLNDSDTPYVIAHRGAMAHFPENTKSAFDAALLHPIYGIELDLQLTKDDVPIVFHDKTLLPLGLPVKKMFEVKLADLKKENILTFEEFLSLYANKTNLFLEIKIRGGG